MKKITNLIAWPMKFSMLAVSLTLADQVVLANPADGWKAHYKTGPASPTASPRKLADIVVKGKVSNKDGPLAGVTVRVNGSSSGVITDDKGNYTLTAPENAILVFSYTGYEEQRIPVKNHSVINVTLMASAKDMETVIVTGYRTQTRGAIIGSVSSVNSSELSNAPVDNLSNALAGRLSGVTINQSSGTPGMSSDIRIRAQGSLTGSTPLFVIDGVISDKFAFDGLSPSEVQDVTILKDAASAAIYGARAANGVVLVTTKRGREGAPKVTYNGMFGFQQPTKVPETLNAYEHASAINLQLDYIKADPNDARRYTPDELEYFKTHSWNWIDAMWQNPLTTQHSLDVSGGSPNVKYFLGGSYNYASGSFPNIDFKKINLRGNVDVSVTKNLKLSMDLNTDTRNTDGPSWDVNNLRYEDLYKALLFRSAMVPPYINGEPVGNFVEWHPGAVLEGAAGYNKRNWTNLNSTVTLNYTVPFVKGLTFKTSYNRFNRNTYQKNFNLPYNMSLFEPTGGHNHIVGDVFDTLKARSAVEFLNSRYDNYKSYQFNAQLNYKRNFGKHGIDALAVYEQSENYSTNFNGQRNDFISSVVDQYSAGSQSNASAGGNEVELGRLSYVGLVNYNYAQKYLLEASFRVDGSPIFAPENRWGFFPAVAAGWKISSEPFFDKVHFVNDLKLRASVGLLGQDNIDPYQWVQTYAIVPGAVFDNLTQGIEEGVLANRNVTWEKALTYNAGLDSRFWNNKMNFKLDVFKRHTYDIQGTRTGTVPNTLGATLGDENYRVVDSKGFEVELGYNGQAGSQKQISYYLRGNFGYSTNNVIRTNEAQNIRPYLAQTGHNTGRIYGLIATGVIRTQADLDKLPAGYTIMGVAPQLGMLNYKDIRGVTSDEPDGKITAEDRDVIAQYSTPPVNYGLSLGGSWKSLSLDVLLQGVSGGYAMLPTAGRDIQARPEESSFRYWADSWSPENPNGKYPGYRVTNYRTRYDESTFFLVNNSFLRLKNISLSYSLPKNLIQKTGLNSVRVFFTGSNLVMLYSGNKIYDPEMNSITSYPMMKAYSFGLNIGL
jgi:TonB-linked SusC/RagA family outer membrane protein